MLPPHESKFWATVELGYHGNDSKQLQRHANIGVIDAEAGRIAVTAGQRKISNIYISIRDRQDFLFLAKGYDYRVMENDSK